MQKHSFFFIIILLLQILPVSILYAKHTLIINDKICRNDSHQKSLSGR